MYAIEHPNIDINRFHSYPTSPILKAVDADNTLSALRDPLQVFAPVKAAQEIVERIL